MAGAPSQSRSVVTVAVPKRLGREAIATLKRTLDEALAEPSVRVLILRGDAEGFSSGMDLSEISESSEGMSTTLESATHGFAGLLETLLGAQPVTVAVVEGPALGGGVGLLAACDLVLATEQASFALPELLLGLVPAMILPVLAERLGLHQAKRWAITQATWQAGEANHRGLVDQFVSVERLEVQLKRTVRSLLRLHPRGVASLKRFAQELDRSDFSKALQQGQALLRGLLERPEVRAEIVAFRDYGILPGALED